MKIKKHEPYKRFKYFLSDNGIKQKHIAELLNLDVVTVNQKINGGLNFYWPEIELICDTYGCQPALFKTSKVS